MTGDLVSLRILLVGAAPVHQDLWREAATQARVPIEFESVAASAARVVLGRGGIDICVLDAAVDGAETATVIGAARAKRPAPLVFACGPPGDARLDTIDGVLQVPANVVDAQKAVDICIRAKMPTRVLIAADSESLRTVVRKILAACRFELDVHEAVDGAGTLERLTKDGFGLVFLDHNMPVPNGADIMQGIKLVRPDLAVVMMLPTLARGPAGRPHLSEAFAFLKKPFYPDDVDAVLQRYFGLGDPS
jgi:CheY-like chemotaxis protein